MSERYIIYIYIFGWYAQGHCGIYHTQTPKSIQRMPYRTETLLGKWHPAIHFSILFQFCLQNENQLQ